MCQLLFNKVSTARLACRSTGIPIKGKATPPLPAEPQRCSVSVLKNRIWDQKKISSQAPLLWWSWLHQRNHARSVFHYMKTVRIKWISAGHIKLVKGAVDPDPTEYLLPSIEMKREDQQKPYVVNQKRKSANRSLFDQVWHKEVCVDHGRQDPRLQGGHPRVWRH